MALKITKAEDPLQINQLVVCIYAPPGLGKSTVGFSAHRPLLLDFDAGAHRAANRGDSVQIAAWEDVANIEAGDVADYSTIVVDTAGRALDLLSASIIKRNPKLGRGGALTIQGYGQLKSEFTAWLKMLRQLGKDIVLIAHASEDKSGDELIERIDMQGGSKQEVYKAADAMGRLHVENRRTYLSFDPSAAAFGKNPGQLDPLPVPNVAEQPDFLGGVIDQIKGQINALSERQQERQRLIESWHETIQAAENAGAINALIPEVQEADHDVQRTLKGILHRHAQGLGLTFDKSAGHYVEQEAA